MISNYRPYCEPLRNALILLALLFLAGLVSACGQSITSGSSPTPTSTQGIRGIFHEYSLLHSQFVPGTITAGPDGNIWFTEIMQNGSVQTGKIERITPTGTLSEFPLPSANTVATNIITGLDGNLWFTAGDKIARITPMGKVSEFSLPFHQYPAGSNPIKEPAGSAQGEPLAITAGPDGNLWFTEIGPAGVGSSIGRITTAGKITEFRLPSVNTFPSSITAGSDGNLWFTEIGTKNGPSKIGVMTPQGKIREFTLSHSILGSITRGPDGNLWFIEVEITVTDPYGTNGKIGHLV